MFQKLLTPDYLTLFESFEDTMYELMNNNNWTQVTAIWTVAEMFSSFIK